MNELKEPLAPNRSKGLFHRGGVAAAIASLFSSTVGCGILGLPFAFCQSGWLLGLLVLFISVVCLSFYYIILFWASDHTGESTYVGIVGHLCGDKWRRVTEASIILHSLGALCAIQALLAMILISLLKTIGWESAEEYRSLIITAFNLIFVFLVIPEELSALRYLSGLAMLATMYVACVVLCETPEYLADSNSSAVPMAKVSMELFDSFSLLIFAFDCSRAVSIVYSELKPRSFNKMYASLLASMAITTALYIAIGLCGFISQGESTEKIVLMRRGPHGEPAETDAYMIIGRFSMAVVLLVAYPVHLSPLKLSMQQFVSGPHFQPNRFRYLSITFGCLLFTYFVAIFLTDAIAYFKVIGGVFVTFTACVLPNIVYTKIGGGTKARLLWGVTALLALIGFGSATRTFI